MSAEKWYPAVTASLSTLLSNRDRNASSRNTRDKRRASKASRVDVDGPERRRISARSDDRVHIARNTDSERVIGEEGIGREEEVGRKRKWR